MTIRLDIVIPIESKYISLLRHIGRTILCQHQAEMEDIDAIEIVIGELCTNVIRHAQTDSGHYMLTFECNDKQFNIVVIDYGEDFILNPPDKPRYDIDGSERYGGFGLELVRKLTDHMEIERVMPRGTAVKVKRIVNKSSPNLTGSLS